MKRITVWLTEEESAALFVLSKQDRRDPRSQAAMLIHNQLEGHGLLKDVDRTKPQAIPGSCIPVGS